VASSGKGAKAASFAVAPGSGRTPERTESLHLFRQKRQAVWPVRQEPYASAAVLHFATDHARKLRWLAHFYSFFWFEERSDELHVKRFARDVLRYRDEVRGAASHASTSMLLRS